MASIVVYIEHAQGKARRSSLECLGAAHATGSQVIAVVSGTGADAVAAGLGAHGAAQAIVLDAGEQHSSDRLAAGLAELIGAQGAKGFLASATSTGKDIAPRVAAHLDSVLFSDCIAIEAAGESFQARRPWLAGKCIATCSSSSAVFCATTRLNVFAVVESDATAEVSAASASAEAKAVVTATEEKQGGALDVQEAPIVISGGRGLKEPAAFSILEDLAAAFGNAAVGASRAVVDLDWRPHSQQVGQTGKVVAPQLYIAVGISGAIQHLAGMRTSKVIVAINKDPDAPIFKVADYGIVGDAAEVIPALTEAVKGVKAGA